MDRPLNKYIDHTLLKADATEEDIRKLATEAVEYDFAAVCVNGCYVRTAVRALAGSDAGSGRTAYSHAGSESTDGSHAGSESTDDICGAIGVAAVVGFPLGAMSTEAKIEEARIAIEDGACEIDMVINIGAAKDGRWDYVRNEIYNIVQICHRSKDEPVILKVILETCLLTDDEVVKACQVCKAAGADYVKTSTGFSDGGATVHHVRLMKETVGDGLKVKASGGIRTLADAKAMIDAGADRLGCSASVHIMQELQTAGESPDSTAQP